MKVFLYQIYLLLSEIEDREVGKKIATTFTKIFLNTNEPFNKELFNDSINIL